MKEVPQARNANERGRSTFFQAAFDFGAAQFRQIDHLAADDRSQPEIYYL